MKKTLQQVHTQINIHTYTNKDTHKNIETHKRKSHMVAAKLDFEEERKYVEILLPKTLNLVEEFLNPSLGNSVLFTVEGEHNDIHCTMEEVNDTFFPPQSWLCSLGDRGCLLGEDMVEKLQLPNLKKKKNFRIVLDMEGLCLHRFFSFGLFEENQLHFGLFEEVQLRFTAWVMTHSLGLVLKLASSQRRKISVEDF